MKEADPDKIFIFHIDDTEDLPVGVIDGLKPVLIGLAANRSFQEGTFFILFSGME